MKEKKYVKVSYFNDTFISKYSLNNCIKMYHKLRVNFSYMYYAPYFYILYFYGILSYFKNAFSK